MKKPKIAGRALVAQANWHVVGGKNGYYRSKLELRHAKHLELLKGSGVIADWEHEPQRFKFPRDGAKSYRPDFRVTYPDGTKHWHEVKGWMDPDSFQHLKYMARYYPGEVVIIIGAKLTDDQRSALDRANPKHLIRENGRNV